MIETYKSIQEKSPLISIIVPVYNGAIYAEGLIAQIKAQTYKNLEVLLIDDGSTDDTVAQCKNYIADDMRFVLFQKENGGAASARNYGLSRAGGEYIAYVDADDYIYPQYIEYLYYLLIKYDADMSCCGCYKMWDTEKIPKFKKSSQEVVFNASEALEDLLYRKNLTGYPVLKLYKRDILKNVCFPEEVIYGEDMLFTLEAIKKCQRVAYGSKILYIYYQHISSITHISNNVSQYKEIWNMQCESIMKHFVHDSPQLIHAAQAKLFILALGILCRIWNENDKDLKKELLQYMRLVDFTVLQDKKCKLMNRILALFSCIDASMLVRMCRLYTWIKRTFKFETRFTV